MSNTKKIIIALFALVLILCFVGCEEANESNKSNLKEESGSHIYIWTDEETGVQYIIYCEGEGYRGMGGITPRLNLDGTLYIEGEDKE